MSESEGISSELALGKITEEMLADMRSKIGTELRVDDCVNNEEVTRIAVLRFSEGIGDPNPLWSDADYAKSTAHRGLIAPPTFIFACVGGVQFGWPGLGGFHGVTDIVWHKVIRVGDRIRARLIFEGFDGPVESKFGGRRIQDFIRQEYYNQSDELVAEFICSRFRFERGDMQVRAVSRTIDLPHPWAPEELVQIESDVLSESPRGSVERYWDDVTIGDTLDTITKGPLGLSDEVAFVASGAAPIPRVAANGVSLRRYKRHPKWAYRDPSTHALEPVYSVHYNDYAAHLQGAQSAYDVGIQRTCWQVHSLTHWMGDSGFLVSIHGEYRSHVYLSDVIRLGGRVTGKVIDDTGRHIVKLETWAENQRGDQVMPGTATVALPSRT
jgi:acyl dehydratase